MARARRGVLLMPEHVHDVKPFQSNQTPLHITSSIQHFLKELGCGVFDYIRPDNDITHKPTLAELAQYSPSHP